MQNLISLKVFDGNQVKLLSNLSSYKYAKPLDYVMCLLCHSSAIWKYHLVCGTEEVNEGELIVKE